MAVLPLFSVSGRVPHVYSHPEQSGSPGGIGWLFTYGGHTGPPFELERQYDADEIILADNPADPGDQTIESYDDDIERCCAAVFAVAGFNITTEDQFLFLFALRGISGNLIAQFFVGTEFKSSEPLSGDEMWECWCLSLATGYTQESTYD